MLLTGLTTADFHASKVVLQSLVQQRLYGLLQVLLVALHRQYIVAALVDDLCGDGFLSSHRVDADDRVFDIHQVQ